MSISVLCVAYQSHSVWSASWLPLILLQYLHSQWQRPLRKIISTSFGVYKLQLSLSFCALFDSRWLRVWGISIWHSVKHHTLPCLCLSLTLSLSLALSLCHSFLLSLSLSLCHSLFINFYLSFCLFFKSITFHSITYLPFDILCRHPMDLSTMANKSTRYAIFP